MQQQQKGLDVANIAAANTKFGLDLFKILLKEKKNENTFLSPFSISVALAMTQLGARENTAKEMAAALRWNVPNEGLIHMEFQKYLTKLQTPTDQYQLSTANRIYIQESFKILDEFLNNTKEKYKAEAVAANFQGNADGEAKKINDWVAEQTQQKIKDLLAPGVLNAMTRMVLVNAIYFKGQWEDKFDEANTVDFPFKTAPGKTEKVPMMKATRKYPFTHSDELKCTALEIPYKGNELSMVVVLPDDDFGLETLMSKLTFESLTTLLGTMDSFDKVDLTFPKFEVTSSFSLKPALSELGMSEAFSNSANFEGMTGARDLFLSAVEHKAFVKVNEEGTEAAAATAAVMMLRCLPMPNPQIRVDHPFFFLIKDKRAGDALLFCGAIVDPSLSS